jgi:hypothetical protein
LTQILRGTSRATDLPNHKAGTDALSEGQHRAYWGSIRVRGMQPRARLEISQVFEQLLINTWALARCSETTGMREPFQRLPSACEKLLKQFSGAARSLYQAKVPVLREAMPGCEIRRLGCNCCAARLFLDIGMLALFEPETGQRLQL